MTPVNGHHVEEPPIPEPAPTVAQAVWDANLAQGDDAWDELTDEERALLTDNALAHISAHMSFLERYGFRILPPGAVLRPKNENECAAMEVAVRVFREAQTRKGGLLLNEKKLILPKGTH